MFLCIKPMVGEHHYRIILSKNQAYMYMNQTEVLLM